MDTKRYKILELVTTGWELREDCNNLPKDECDQRLRFFIDNGISPKRLKVVRVA